MRNENGWDTLLFPDNGAWRMAATPLGRHFPIPELFRERADILHHVGTSGPVVGDLPVAYSLYPPEVTSRERRGDNEGLWRERGAARAGRGHRVKTDLDQPEEAPRHVDKLHRGVVHLAAHCARHRTVDEPEPQDGRC